MSGNQKQTATGGPQTQRFTNQHFAQVIQPQQQRADGYAVSSGPAYIAQQPNQGGNQGPGLRGGIPSTGQSNQASTPPNTDIKVQSIQQPTSINTVYVRSQQNFFTRTPGGPPNQGGRMANQHNRGAPQAPIYPQPQGQYAMPMSLQHQMYITAAPFYGASGGQRQQNFMPPIMHAMQPYPTSYPTTYNTANPTANPYFYNPMLRAPPPQQNAAPPNPTQQPIPNMPLPPATPQHPAAYQSQRHQNKRRDRAIPIIDPSTGKDCLTELYGDSSHPASGESSARQTPQPTPQNAVNKEVQSLFARQVAQAITNDTTMEQAPASDYHHHHNQHDATAIQEEDPPNPTHYPSPHNTAVQQPTLSRYDLVQSSKLKAQAKEFVLNNKSTKEPPIVSANCDAAEVTLPSKQNKDRESPVKSRNKHNKEHREKEPTQPIIPPKEQTEQTVLGDKSSQAAASAASAVDKNDIRDSGVVVGSTNTITAPTVINKEPTKKDGKLSESKVPSVESESVPVTTFSTQPQTQDSGSTKSKQNHAHKVIQQQQQQQPQGNKQAQSQQKPTLISVPATQQPKPNNKSNKKNEINLKGANKEGTDMDAISDSTPVAPLSSMQNEDAVNANIKSNDVVNSNSISNAGGVVVSNTASEPAEDLNKKPSDLGTTIIKVTEKQVPKTQKFSVCNIVKDQPKVTIKPVQQQQQPQPPVDQDDSERTGSNERLVQAKNEANTKEVNSNSNVPDIQYEDGQWSPANLAGKKIYNKEFLMLLKNMPASKIKPTNIIDAISADDNRRLPEGRYSSMGGRGTDFSNPPYGKSSSQRGGVTQRKSSQLNKTGGSGKNNKSTGRVPISLSLRDDVKLNLTENAWKPDRLNKTENMTDEDKKTEELYKKVRGVLNKLTPQKFDTLLGQVRTLKIGTAARLQGVIDLVFEKAVDEPNFSVAYALMCRELALIQVPTANNNPQEFVNFRKLLITRCQYEFEKQSVDETERAKKLKEIEACSDAEKKKDMMFEFEEHERKLRMKSVGNIRFIGELFKQQMLTVNIMMRCLHNLLDNKEEESLECLCKLLTTIGKELESKGVGLENIFKVMKEIVDKKHLKVSSRVKFMLQDVIDLRSSKWVPRRQDLNPKTIDQIQKEAADEQLNIQAMNALPTPRKDDRGGSSNMNSDRDRKGRKNISEDGWISSGRSNRSTPFSVQSDKLKNKPPQMEEMSLGSSNFFSNWSKGSNIKTPAPPVNQSNNIYSALDKAGDSDVYAQEKKPNNRRDNYHSKGASLERNNLRSYEGRDSRSGSQHRSNDSSASSSQRSTPAPVPQPPPVSAKPVPGNLTETLTEEQLERRFKNCLDEYVSDNIGTEEFDQEIRAVVPESYNAQLITNILYHVLEKNKMSRLKTSSLLTKLIELGTISLDDLASGLTEFFENAEDFIIDIPMYWEYFAEILCMLICEKALPLSRLQKMLSLLSSNSHGKFIGTLFSLVADKKDEEFLASLWQVSELKLADVVGSQDPQAFLKEFKLEFLMNTQALGEGEFSYEQIQCKLTEFFITKTSFDDIVVWIDTNVGERVKEKKFIRALVTAIFKDCIKKDSLIQETYQRHSKLLQKYIDNNSNYELQCLYAVQALVNEMEHPKGLLLTICNNLYESWSVSQESFMAWESSQDPAEQGGKGVALMQLTCFLKQLKEDYESASDE